MDSLACTAEPAPEGTMFTSSLPKAKSNSSLNSSVSAENSPTLYEQTPAEPSAADNAHAVQNHSREISFLDLAPADLDISEALGGRSAATIECLRINRCRMDGGAFLNLASALCSYDLSSLHTVDLSQNHLSGAEAGMALARILSHAKSVRFLSLGWNRLLLSDLCPIISANEKALASTSQTYEIECLDLRANPLTPVLKRSSKKSTKHRSVHKECGDEFIGALVASMPNLTHIQLAQATIGDRELISLLRSLTRPGSRVEYVGLEWLGLGSRLSALREMLGNMASGDMTSAAATVAHPLVAVHLNLSANNLGDSGVEVITSSGAVLQSLTLACNFITERGTGLLAEWLPKLGLRLLDLSDNYFGDQGIVSLLATHSHTPAGACPATPTSSYCTQITTLGLTSCCLSDASLRMLSEALACNWAPLESLRILRNSRMSPGAKLLL